MASEQLRNEEPQATQANEDLPKGVFHASPEKPMPAILLIGEDECLLETRAAVLRLTGADLAQADPSAALPLLHRRLFDLVIVCHSVPEHVCQTLSSIIRDNWPHTRILHISDVYTWESEQEGVQVCNSDPGVLIARTVELLGRRPVAPVRHPLTLRRSA